MLKRSILFCLLFGFIAAGALALTPVLQAQEAGCRVRAENVVNRRAGPGTEYAILDVMERRGRGMAVGQAKAADGETWYLMRNDTWVWSGAVTPLDDCSDLPEVNADGSPAAGGDPTATPRAMSATAGATPVAIAPPRAPVTTGDVTTDNFRDALQDAYAQYWNEGDLDGTRALLESVIAAVPDDAEAYAALANVNRAEAGDADETLRLIDEALARDPDSALAYAVRARFHYDNGDRRRANEDIERALALDPASPEARYYQAVMLWFGDSDARAALDAFGDADLPDYSSMIHLRGWLIYQNGDAARGATEVSRAISLRREVPGTWYLDRGLMYLDLARYQDAVADFDQSIALDPENPWAYNNRGWAYYNLGDAAAAQADFEQALALDPANETAQANLEAVLAASGNRTGNAGNSSTSGQAPTTDIALGTAQSLGIPAGAAPQYRMVYTNTLLREFFDDNARGWTTRDEWEIEMAVGGELRVRLNRDYGQPAAISLMEAAPVRFSAPYRMQVYTEGGSCTDACEVWLLYNVRDARNYDLAIYNPASAAYTWAVASVSDGALSVRESGTEERPRDVFDFGDDYDFQLFVREDTVALYLSGNPVFEVSNPNGVDGGIGLGVAREVGESAAISFSSVRVEDWSHDEATISEADLSGFAPTDLSAGVIEETFDDNTFDWSVGDDPLYTLNVADGVYTLRFDETEGDAMSNAYLAGMMGATDFASAPRLTTPYTFEVDLLELTSGQPLSGCVHLLFDVQPELKAHQRFAYCNNAGQGHSINLGRIVENTYTQNAGEANNLPIPAQNAMFDKIQRFGVRREEGLAVFTINGQDLFAATLDMPIDGTIGLGVKGGAFVRDPEIVTAVFDNLTIAPITVDPALLVDIEEYSEAQLIAFRDDPATLYFEDFESGTWRGPGGTSGGALELALTSAGRGQRLDLNGLETVAEPFEVEFEIDEWTQDADGYIALYFNDNEFTAQGLFTSTTEQGALSFYLTDRQWGYNFEDTVFGGSVDFYPLPSGLRLADGRPHRVKWRVELPPSGITVTLFIDDREAASYLVPQGVINAVYRPFVTTIDGGVYLRAGATGDAGDSANITLDNLIVRRYVAGDLVAGTGLGPVDVEYTSEIARLKLTTPAGWIEDPRASALSTTSDYYGSHVVTMYNARQGITGAANEIGFSLYDAVVVTAQTLIPDTRAVDLETVLEAMVRSTSGDDIWAQSTVETTQIGDRDVVTARGQGQAEYLWLAMRASDGRAMAMVFLTSPDQLDEFMPTITAIVESADYPAPSEDYDPAERAALAHLTFAYQGLLDSAVNTSCFEDVLTIQFGGLLLEDLGQTASTGTFDPIKDYQGANFVVDTSGLFLESLDTLDDGVAQVRVGGIVTRRYNDGTVQSIPHDSYFLGLYDQYFGAEVLRLEGSGNAWNRCTGAFTFGD